MRPRTLLVLAGLVAALLAFILLYEHKLPSTDERRERAKRLFAFEADDVTSLEIDWEGRKVRLERPPKSEDTNAPARTWKLLEPPLGNADSTALDRIVGDLARLEFERELSEVDRKDAGLDPPRGTVRWGGKAAGAVRIGGELPAANQVLVEVEGRAGAFVIPRWLVTDLTRSPGDWRAREVVPFGREKIARIALEPASGGRIVLVKAGERFRLEAPLADEADRDSVDRLLTDLVALRIARFLDSPLAPEAEAGLAQILGRVEVGAEGVAEPIRIEVGGEVAQAEGERYHRAGAQTFTARSDLRTALEREPSAWRSRSWSGFESFEVEKIAVRDSQGELVLVREGSDWKVGEKTVPYAKVGDLLYTITSARAEKLHDLAGNAPVPAAPFVTLTLGASGGREEVLTLHGREEAQLRGRRSGRAVELEFPKRLAEDLEAQLRSVREELARGSEAPPPQAGATPAPN